MLKLRLERGDKVLVNDQAILHIEEISGLRAAITLVSKDGGVEDLTLTAGNLMVIGGAAVQVHSHTRLCLELRFEAPRSVRIVTVKQDPYKQFRNSQKRAA